MPFDLAQLILAITIVPIARAFVIFVTGMISTLSRNPERRRAALTTLRQVLRHHNDSQ